MASEKFSPPWQSFVDCLSTVLLIMVFFSIVLVILVSVLSYSISKKEMTMEKAESEKKIAEEIVADEEAQDAGAPVDIENFLTKGEDRFIIYYSGLLSEASEEVMERFKDWVATHDPDNNRTMTIVQQVVINDVSISNRRLTGFKRYYALSRFTKNVIGNKKAIKSFSVIKGEQEENRAIITFEK